MARRKNTFEKKIQVSTGFCRVTGQLGFCSSWSFVLPGPVQPPSQLDLGSTREACPGLITMLGTARKLSLIYRVK
jgi:hypothetical protein